MHSWRDDGGLSIVDPLSPRRSVGARCSGRPSRTGRGSACLRAVQSRRYGTVLTARQQQLMSRDWRFGPRAPKECQSIAPTRVWVSGSSAISSRSMATVSGSDLI